MEDKKLLSTKEAAVFLGVSRKTIQRYRSERFLTPDAFGKNNTALYSEEQLLEVVKRFLSSTDTL